MKAWTWLKRWGGALFGALTAVLLTVVTLGWWVRRKDAQIASLKDEKTVAEASSEVKRLGALREEVELLVDEEDKAIAELDERIRVQRRKVADVLRNQRGGEMSDEELEKALKRALGG